MQPPYELNEAKLEQHDSGLEIQIIERGKGPMAEPGQTVVAHYHGTLEDGSLFDSSFQRGQPLEFPLGRQMVIQGWEEAFSKLPVGSKAILRVPHQLAYGERGYPGAIPPKATLRFDVEFVDAK